MIEPKVTVIIPLYNKEKYVKRAVDSVLAQTFIDFELIIVDDGSTDGSVDVVKGYDDKRIRIIQQTNSGPGAARNRGAAEAKGAFLAFLDADDEWLPEYLQTIDNVRKDNPDCNVIVSNWIADFSRHPQGLRNVNLSLYLKNEYGIEFKGFWNISCNIAKLELELIASRFTTSAVSCSKYVFNKYNGFGVDSNYGEDWVLWLNFIFCEDIYFIDDALMKFHDEASGLWCGGAMNNKLELYFYKYNDLLRNCPDEYKCLLKKWFVIRALKSAHNRLGYRKWDDVRYLIDNFNLLQSYTIISYLKLRIKMFLYSYLKK